ncbi:MAG: NAD(P)-dependent oxidoreductase [Phycisphaerae bacterium]
MRVLITGSSGQIGTNLGLALLQRGDSVDGVDIRPNTWTDQLPTRLLDLSRAAPADVSAGRSYDAVVHLAAFAKVFELVEHPDRALQNVQMAFAALECARRGNTPFIFASSREVYGDIHRHITDEAAADFVVAESPYSASKIAGEAFVYSYAQCYELPYLVFRFSNVYGRFDADLERMERVIPLFVRKIARGEPLIIYGREKILDFTYYEDAVAGIIRGLDALVARARGRPDDQPRLRTGQLAGRPGQHSRAAIGGASASRYDEPARAGEVMATWLTSPRPASCWGYAPARPCPRG